MELKLLLLVLQNKNKYDKSRLLKLNLKWKQKQNKNRGCQICETNSTQLVIKNSPNVFFSMLRLGNTEENWTYKIKATSKF